jgi:hypothetical protein
MDGRKPQESFAANEEPELKKLEREREREREIKGFLFVRRKSEVTRHVTVLLPAFATVLLNSERRRRLAFSIQKQAGETVPHFGGVVPNSASRERRRTLQSPILRAAGGKKNDELR